METRPDYITQAEDTETALTVDTTDRNPFEITLQDWFRPGPHARKLHGDNRIVADQRAALVAEVRRLNALNRDLHSQAVDAEERATAAAKRLEEYANEREAVQGILDRAGILTDILYNRVSTVVRERDDIKRMLVDKDAELRTARRMLAEALKAQNKQGSQPEDIAG